MKLSSLRSFLLLAGLAGGLQAADCCKDPAASCCGPDKACCATPADAKSAAYPLKTCVVSGDKLGDMGEPYTYVHKQEGQPDRQVLFCCKGCVKDFKKDPAKYLKLLDEAAAART